MAEMFIRNPFYAGIIQKADDFCNREEEKQELLKHAINGNNVVIVSPRRCGKSSFIGRVQEDLEKRGFRTVYVDMFSVISETDFILRFASA
ncbi:MAG TPA: ATPase, partial [Nitrospirota bacterium]|nr:ATPase [Nitrospirota bacterium]